MCCGADTDGVAHWHRIRVAAAVLPTMLLQVGSDDSESLSELLDRAIETVIEEQRYVTTTGPETAPDRQALLADVDGRGAAILAQLDVLDVELSDDARLVLDRLPMAESGAPPPTAAQYDATITELNAIRADQRVEPGNNDRGLTHSVRIALAAGTATAIALLFGLNRRRRDRRLIDTAFRDTLTGLSNRRRLDDDVLSMVTTAVDRSVIAMMVDVDHFKSFNERFGHALGDKVLKDIAETIAAQVRSTDVAYRYGGEEFCVLLPGTSLDDARIVAERILQAVAELRTDPSSTVSVSIGLAIGPQRHAANVLNAADGALDDAKRAGRNTIATARPPSPPM
jgi:diguanylate cyclase (GGDEF)-like protein